MQVFPNSYLFTFPKPLNPPSPLFHFHRLPPPLLLRKPPPTTVAKSFTSDEFPVDETFEQTYRPKSQDAEDEARKRNWIERGWAPWEEILTIEAQFARHSLNEGEEIPLQSPESIEAFKMMNPNYRKKKIEEMGLTEEEFLEKQFEIKGDIPEPLETKWAGPLVVRLVPPRDWPPRGWEVDRKELEFIREAHKLQAKRVRLEDIENGVTTETDDVCLDRYKVFLKQYNEWVEANKDLLEEESYKIDQDYHPGRRKRGKDYKEGMYELPFYYPGQICVGKVTTLHLYQGAFVDIGGVYDGWVPIKNNDWFWIRHHINVGMTVIVEITAKRDPYRFRFPIELRFVDPNIDHLIFNRFEFPPMFHREEDTNPDELRRDSGRPPVPRKELGDKPEEEPLFSNHPYVEKLWQINVAEQMILTDMDINPDKYKGKKLSDLVDGEDFDEEKSVQHTKVQYKNALVPKVTLKTSVKELDLEAALAERELHKKLWKEAEDRGEEYKITTLKRNIEMDEYDFMHWRRSFEEREALIRDISCRKTLGLPLEEPGRYVDASYFKDLYDPKNPLYRSAPGEELKDLRQARMTETHNQSIVGAGTALREMPYEDAIKLQGQEFIKYLKQGEVDIEADVEDDEDDEDDDDDFDFSMLRNLLGNTDVSDKILVNGTETSTLSDESVFEE